MPSDVNRIVEKEETVSTFDSSPSYASIIPRCYLCPGHPPENIHLRVMVVAALGNGKKEVYDGRP